MDFVLKILSRYNKGTNLYRLSQNNTKKTYIYKKEKSPINKALSCVIKGFLIVYFTVVTFRYKTY